MMEGLCRYPSVEDDGILTVSFRDLRWAVRTQNLIHIVNINNKDQTTRILFIFRRPLSDVTDTVVIVLVLKTHKEGSCSHLLPLGSEDYLLIQGTWGMSLKCRFKFNR